MNTSHSILNILFNSDQKWIHPIPLHNFPLCSVHPGVHPIPFWTYSLCSVHQVNIPFHFKHFYSLTSFPNFENHSLSHQFHTNIIYIFPVPLFEQFSVPFCLIPFLNIFPPSFYITYFLLNSIYSHILPSFFLLTDGIFMNKYHIIVLSALLQRQSFLFHYMHYRL